MVGTPEQIAEALQKRCGFDDFIMSIPGVAYDQASMNGLEQELVQLFT